MCFSFELCNQLYNGLHYSLNVISDQLFMCHMRACASPTTVLFCIICYSVYKLENRSVGGEDEMENKIDYRGLVNRIAIIALPHNQQTVPCHIYWRGKKKALNLSLVSFFIIKLKTTRRNTEGVFLLKVCSLGNMSSSPTL